MKKSISYSFRKWEMSRTIRSSIFCFIALIFVSQDSVLAEILKWDYIRQPVGITENKPTPVPCMELGCITAFDGYGAQGEKSAAIRAWVKEALPTPASPYSVDVDYGQPVGVSCFVHYFYVPGSRDLRYIAPIPSAFKTVRILSKNDQDDWSEVALLEDLPAGCPQKLITGSSTPARYWRIEVLELAASAERMCSYEIETYSGGVPELKPWTQCVPDFLAQFQHRITHHEPKAQTVCSFKAFEKIDKGAALSFKADQQLINGTFELLVDGQPCVFQKIEKDRWQTSTPSGTILLDVNKTEMGLLLNLAFDPIADSPSSYRRASVQLSADNVDLYYIPAYMWDTHTPGDMMINSCNVQTRMAGLGTQDTMLLLVPGTDRGTLGFINGCARNDLLLSTDPTPILISVVRGDWWAAYQFAVTDVYDFQEPLQSVPVSEIQYGISRYILRDDVWEPTLGTMKAWPSYDFCTEWFDGFDCHAFYGAPYSIPAYWARYRMNGDQQARQRCKQIVDWLCTSGVRSQEGPTQGAFFTIQRFGKLSVQRDQPGCTQAVKPWLTSQATGAALWSLLYYRKVTGERDPQIDQVIQEAVAWLLKTQQVDGGWPYGHALDGTEVPDAAPGSGTIWNIWALWRLGKETDNSQYLEAAEKAKQWYKKTFVIPHHYHGYWEDVGPGSREGYEAAVATVAFGEMGEKELVVETARDAMQWIFTRQIECREANCSAGLVAEQTGWPPAAYCNPMMALAAWTAWQTTNDDFWRPFARIPKAIGWWYQPETGGIVWIVDSLAMAPIVGPCLNSWWCDWNSAQIGSLTLRWLVREVNLHSINKINIDEEILTGNAIGSNVKLWAPPGGLHPNIPPDGQVNWLGFRGEHSIMIAFVNYGEKGQITCPLDSRDVEGASLQPKTVHDFKHDTYTVKSWDGAFPLDIEKNQMIVCEWATKM